MFEQKKYILIKIFKLEKKLQYKLVLLQEIL